ncbi:hypothetical protein [Rhodoferax sp. U11-2br]|uniref:hypothetical protein n=1 Tax=Rhodoferax sp. U11-2br TaxID=2838878 RepID=UPI001BECCC3C|nr:hypothetical protein [Rhodoferax sp. U11-2br]MBT3068773.1 hypothetical protein [Rhodoferax sp. U11-2br]
MLMDTKIIFAIFFTVLTFSACSRSNFKWTEDVLLQDGQQVTITRALEGLEAFGGVGDAGGTEHKATTITFPPGLAGAPTAPLSTHFNPMVLNKTPQGQWYVLAIIQICEDWKQIGYPKLPYTQYNWTNGAWQQVPLDPVHIGEEANLLVAVHRKSGEPPHHTLESKRAQDDAATMFSEDREIVNRWNTSCVNSKGTSGHLKTEDKPK